MCFPRTGFRHRHLGTQRGRIVTEFTEMLDKASDTAASTPIVTVGPGSWSRCRITVRTLRAPAGRVLVRSTGRGSACGGTRPASVSRCSCRWARAARILRHGSAAQRNGGGACTVGTAASRPKSAAASADIRMPSPSEWVACTTATVPAPVTPGTPSTGVKTCSRQVITGVQLAVGQRAHRGQTSRPAVVGEIVHHGLARIDAANPRRVGQNTAVLDPQRQLRAAPGALADRSAPARARTAHRRTRTARTGRWESWQTSSTSAHRPLPSGGPSCCSRLGS